jgi:Ca2+-binding RTX toxin-like protein
MHRTGRRRSGRRTWMVVPLAAAIAMSLSTTAASGATVEASEGNGPKPARYASLSIEAQPGEANRLSIAIGGEPGHFVVDVRDEGESIVAGAGCADGGGPGAVVHCALTLLPGVTTVVLGDRGSSLDASTLSSAVHVMGGAGNDTISTGSAEDAVFATRCGPDFFTAGCSAAATEGPSGDDLIVTGAGTDWIAPGDGSNRVKAGADHDWLIATTTPNGADLIDLGEGVRDVADYRLRREPFTYVADDLANDGAAAEGDAILNAEFVVAGAADDRLVGDGRNDYLFGGGGDDLLVGSGGRDFLAGEYGEGDDLDSVSGIEVTRFRVSYPIPNPLSFHSGADRAFGGAGNDVLRLDGGNDTGFGGAGADLITGNLGADALFGNGGRDRLFGQRDRNRLNGGPSFDRCRLGNRASVAIRCEAKAATAPAAP